MSAGGRPSKFTPEVTEPFLARIRAGHYLNYAAAEAGIGLSTVKAWLKRGTRTGEADKPYREFRAAYQEARVKGLILIEANVLSEAARDPQLGLRVLERLCKERWSTEAAELRQLKKIVERIEAKVDGVNNANGER